MNKSPLIDFEKGEVFLSALQYLFVRTKKGVGTILSEGCVSFVTSTGFFAALGHNEETDALSYENAELYAQHTEEDDPPQAGRVLCSTPTGVYGAFYDDYIPPVFSKLKVAPLESLTVDASAELWMPIGVGKPRVFSGKIAALFPGKPHPVLFEVQDDLFSGAQFGCSGSVIVQNGRIAAVVAGANENPASLLYCTSAEQMAIDLGNMIHGFAILEEPNSPEEFSKKVTKEGKVEYGTHP